MQGPGFGYIQQHGKIESDINSINLAAKNISARSAACYNLSNKYRIPNGPFVKIMNMGIRDLTSLQQKAQKSFNNGTRVLMAMPMAQKDEAKLKGLAKAWGKWLNEYRRDSSAFKAQALALQGIINKREKQLESQIKK